MKVSSAALRAEIEVLTRSVAAFGIGKKGLGKVNRMALHRAATGQMRRLATLQRTHQALLTLMLRDFRAEGQAGSGGANEFADAMLMSSLNIYPKIKTELVGSGPLSASDLRLLIEEVIVPTAFAIMSRTGMGEVRGLGSEFFGPKSWYLPEGDRPFAAILGRWLHVTGFRTPCGFSRDSTNLKKQVSRWLKGETLPSIEDLDSLVKRYSQRVEWLDGADAWKARFRLARALQHLWVSAEGYFSTHHNFRPRSAKILFETINAEKILRDADGLLANPEIFFAVRLVQQKLQREGILEDAITPKRKNWMRSFPLSSTEGEIDRYRLRASRRLDVGHRLVRYLARRGRIPLGPELGRPSLKALARFEAYVFSLGVRELKRMRNERRLAH